MIYGALCVFMKFVKLFSITCECEFGNLITSHRIIHSLKFVLTAHTMLSCNYITDPVSGANITNGPIRLFRNGVTSSSYTSGRVQLVYNRQWGNICDDVSFGITEANVVCHQLGFTGASSQSRASTDT